MMLRYQNDLTLSKLLISQLSYGSKCFLAQLSWNMVLELVFETAFWATEK